MQDTATFQEKTFGSEQVLALIADKWTVQILHAVMDGYDRFGELRRAIPSISRRMLTLRLRELERNGLLERIDYEEVPPRVEYQLTHLADSLAGHLRALCLWSKDHFDEVEEARDNYDAKNN